MLTLNALALLSMPSLQTSQEGVYAIGDAKNMKARVDLIAVNG